MTPEHRLKSMFLGIFIFHKVLLVDIFFFANTYYSGPDLSKLCTRGNWIAGGKMNQLVQTFWTHFPRKGFSELSLIRSDAETKQHKLFGQFYPLHLILIPHLKIKPD